MTDRLLLRELHHILGMIHGASTGELMRALINRGYVGSVGYLTWQLHQEPTLSRGVSGKWTIVARPALDAGPARQASGARPNASYGLHRCAHVGRCSCRQLTGQR